MIIFFLESLHCDGSLSLDTILPCFANGLIGLSTSQSVVLSFSLEELISLTIAPPASSINVESFSITSATSFVSNMRVVNSLAGSLLRLANGLWGVLGTDAVSLGDFVAEINSVETVFSSLGDFVEEQYIAKRLLRPDSLLSVR